MRLTAASLVLSFFVPAVCAIATNWNSAAPSCSQMNHSPEPAPVVSPCCLSDAIQRPALQEVVRQDVSPAPTPGVVLGNPHLEVPLLNVRVAGDKIVIGDTGPPSLYLLHASLLI